MARPKKIVQPEDLPVRSTHSQVVTVSGGTLVFVAGMTSRSEKDAAPVHPGDMRAQLRQVCQNIGRALRSVGADFPDVVKTTTFTTDVDEYHRVADERFKYFTRLDQHGGARIMSRLIAISLVAAAAWLGTSLARLPAAEAQAKRVTVQMDWVIGGAHGGFFVAKEKGFYAARGLDVTINRGFGSGDTIKVVAAGKLDFGFANIPASIVSRGKGAPVKQIAVVIGKAPESFVSFEEKGIRTLKDLEGKSFLEAAGAATVVTWPAFAKLAGIDINKMTFIAVEAAAKPAAFFGGRGDLAFGFRPGFDEPVIVRARKEGRKLVYLRWEDYGWKVYGSGIVATDELLKRDPKLAADFVAATMDGYRWAIENHEQALEIFVKANPEVDRDTARLGLLVAIDGLLTPAGREHGLGAMDPERMAFQIDMLAKLNNFPRPAADEIYTNQFIKKGPVTVPAALQAELTKMP